MERWNAWWWAPDEWRLGPDGVARDPLPGKGGGGGGGGLAAYKAADPSSPPMLESRVRSVDPP